MFKGFNNRQQNGFTNLNFNGDYSAYGQSGCNFWLRADLGLNTQTNLGAVSLWQDYVSGITFGQSTAGSQPRLLTSSASYNNLPVVEFVDANRFMSLPSNLINISSIAFIANYDSISTQQNHLLSGGQGNISLGGQTANVNGITVTFEGATISGTTENTNAKICVISRNLIMVNGVVENSSTFNFSGAYNTIGRASAASGLSGKVAEIIGFSTSLNQDQALAVSNNINAKYVIY
jgi:hypothetical protein